MARCRSCGEENEEGAKFCVHCGTSFSEVKKCEKCGHENPLHGTYCGECGAELPSRAGSAYDHIWDKARESQTPSKECPSCGSQMGLHDSVCSMCGSSEWELGRDEFLRASPSPNPAIAGVLLITGGALAILYSIAIMALGAAVYGGMDMTCCGGLEFLFGAAAIGGGLSSLNRSSFTIAIVGAVLCLLSIGPLFLSSLLGLIGLIFVAMSHNEFS